MATEPDQTRWVGIRPTPDCNDIPTTSKKQAPAVADLQAIKENIGGHFVATNQDCTVSRLLASGLVLEGDIWVITHMTIYNETSICDMIVEAHINGNIRSVKQFNSYEPDIYGEWNGLLILEKDDNLVFTWLLGGAADTLTGIWHGYKIGVY